MLIRNAFLKSAFCVDCKQHCTQDVNIMYLSPYAYKSDGEFLMVLSVKCRCLWRSRLRMVAV